MNKKYFMIALLFVAIVIFFLWHSKTQRISEASYEGRTITEWLEDYDACNRPDTVIYSNRDKVLKVAISAIGAIGTNGLPDLLLLYRSQDSKLFNFIYPFVNCFGLHEYIPDKNKHNYASDGFFILGTNALPAAKDLETLTRTGDKSVRLKALHSLEDIEAWPQLLSAFTYMYKNDPDADVRSFAAGEIALIFPEKAEKAGVFTVYPEYRKYLNQVADTNGTRQLKKVP